MTKWRWACVAILLALGALVFGACGGGDDDDDGGDEPRATEPADDDEPAEEGEQQDEEESEDEPSGGGDTGEFIDNAEKFVDASFKATYDATFSEAEGAPGSFTMYKSGTDKFRFDATSTVEGVEMEFIFISAGDTSGFCLTDAGELGALLGVEPGEGVCFDSDPTQGGFGTLSDQLNQFEDEELADAEGLPDREVAGETVKCGRDADVDGASTEVCFTNDGVLAYLKADDGTEFSATDFGDAPSDSDFELPYKVKDFPGIGE
jgi:hypothetical protein